VKKIKYSDFTKEQLERIRLSEKQFKEGKYKTLEEIKRKFINGGENSGRNRKNN